VSTFIYNTNARKRDSTLPYIDILYNNILTSTTFLDTGCNDINLLDEVAFSLLKNSNITIYTLEDKTQIIGFNNSCIYTNTKISIDTVIFKFDNEIKHVERNLEFLLIPLKLKKEPTFIISNKCLKTCFAFDIVAQLAAHVKLRRAHEQSLIPRDYPEPDHLYNQSGDQAVAFLAYCMSATSIDNNDSLLPPLADSESLTEYINEALLLHQEGTNFKEEWDPVYSKSPSAFWFGIPETESELVQNINNAIAAAAASFSSQKEFFQSDKQSELKNILTKFKPCLRTRLGNDKVAKIEPFKLKLLPGTQPIKAKFYTLPKIKEEALDRIISELTKAGLIYRNLNSRWASLPHLVGKAGGLPGEYRLVQDYKYINAHSDTILGTMTDVSLGLQDCQGARYFFTADFLKGFWQVALHEDSKDYFSFITNSGVYTPNRLPQGAADSPLYFHSNLTKIFDKLIKKKRLKLWIDDVLIFSKTWEEFKALIIEFLQTCDQYDLQVNIGKTTVCSPTATWCGRHITASGVTRQARNTDTFRNMPEPLLAGDLAQFLMGINWMREGIYCPTDGKIIDATQTFAAISQPLWDLLNQVYELKGSRARRRYKNVKLADVGWNVQHSQAFATLKHRLHHLLETAFRIPGSTLCLFTDASDKYYSALLAQVETWQEDKPITAQKLCPITTLSGEFKNHELNWRIIEKEAYPLLQAIKAWDHYLATPDGFHVYGDHKNLILLFHPEKISPTLHKGAQDRIYHWLTLLGQYKITKMEHLAGDDNLWADLLSRWGNPAHNQPASSTSIHMVQTRKSKKVPQPEAIAQNNSLVNKFLQIRYEYGSVADANILPDNSLITIAQNNLSKADNEWYHQKSTNSKLYRDEATSLLMYKTERSLKPVIWIPADNIDLITRLCITAHCGQNPSLAEAGHRGITITLAYLQERFWWHKMANTVARFCHACLSCTKAKHCNDIVPRPLGRQLKAAKINDILSIDYLYIGLPCKDTTTDYKYIIILKDEFSGYIDLIPTVDADSSNAAYAIRSWVARYGTEPTYIISDQGSHFKNRMIDALTSFYGIDHYFTLPHCPWSNGGAERVCKEVVQLLTILTLEYKLPTDEWAIFIPSLIQILNRTKSPSRGNLSPLEIFLGREGYSPFDKFFTATLNRDPITSEITSQDYIDSKNRLIEQIRIMNLQVQEHREQYPRADSSTNTLAFKKFRASELGIPLKALKESDLMPRFQNGDYVLIATPHSTKQHKLTATWKGPYRVLKPISDYVYSCQHLITKKDLTAHIRRIRYYSNQHIDIPVGLLDTIQHESNAHHMYHIESIVDVQQDRDTSEWKVLIKWEGFSELENTWEDIQQIHQSHPQLTQAYLSTITDKTILTRVNRLLKVKDKV